MVAARGGTQYGWSGGEWAECESRPSSECKIGLGAREGGVRKRVECKSGPDARVGLEPEWAECECGRSARVGRRVRSVIVDGVQESSDFESGDVSVGGVRDLAGCVNVVSARGGVVREWAECESEPSTSIGWVRE
eukprot:49023-Pleurochrysis_carterae.AAC.2